MLKQRTTGRPVSWRGLPPSDLPEILPQGTARPDLPAEIFDAALGTVLEQRRLDMRALAVKLGIGRTTLYRKAGTRDQLLGEVLWYLVRLALVRALRRATGRFGADRVLTVIEEFSTCVSRQPGVHRLLHAEPEAALRILTSRRGIVQRNMVETVERLLAVEEQRSGFRPALDRHTLAYVVVRIAEGFLYADVVADKRPDVPKAVAVISRLLRA